MANNTFVAGNGIGHVLRVGDTFTSITGVLKYAHGSWGNDGDGGYLPICMLMDPTLLAGRNQAFPSNATGSVVAAAAVVGAQVTVPNINVRTKRGALFLQMRSSHFCGTDHPRAVRNLE